jgi:lysophospholipase L1-like esterase
MPIANFMKKFPGLRAMMPRISLLVIAGLCCLQQKTIAANGHWVTTWGCAPQLTEPGNVPAASLANNTLRQFVRSSIGGSHLRVRFSNAYGTSPVTMNSVHIALAPATASGSDGSIYTATDKALTFHGAPSINIPPGEVVYSDPLDYSLPALTNVAISIYFGNLSSTTICGHPGSRSGYFIESGNAVTAANMSGATTAAHWYIITGMEVLAGSSSKTISILGDSITDGRGSTDNANNRWPDDLANRLITNAPTAGVGVDNMGVGGNGLFGGLGVAAQNRFDRDVLNQSGARYFIVFEGVNDIGGDGSATTNQATSFATSMIAVYTQFANKAHARYMLAYGATITPFGGNGYFTTLHEFERQTVNAWFRTNTVYDGVLDFDVVARDPANPININPLYYNGLNASDGLHMNPAGYQALATNIDLSLFTH